MFNFQNKPVEINYRLLSHLHHTWFIAHNTRKTHVFFNWYCWNWLHILKPHWPFVRRIHRSPVDSPHKGQQRGALIFSLICAWTNGWANNWDVCDLRRHRAHYDVTVMLRWVRHGAYWCIIRQMKIYEFRFIFHWRLFLRVKLTISQHLLK